MDKSSKSMSELVVEMEVYLDAHLEDARQIARAVAAMKGITYSEYVMDVPGLELRAPSSDPLPPKLKNDTSLTKPKGRRKARRKKYTRVVEADIVDALEVFGSLTHQGLADKLKIGRTTSAGWLKSLHAEGKLICMHKGRTAIYALPAQVEHQPIQGEAQVTKLDMGSGTGELSEDEKRRIAAGELELRHTDQ